MRPHNQLLFLYSSGILSLLFFQATFAVNIPLASCQTARFTFYPYTGQGACHLNKAWTFGPDGQANYPYTVAPNEAFYNNSYLCGTCLEMVGSEGRAIAIVTDICPVDGNPHCAGDVVNLDTSMETVPVVSKTGWLNVAGTFRVVACDVTGPVKAHIMSFSNQWDWFLVPTNLRVGVDRAEYQQQGSTAWIPCTRDATNLFKCRGTADAGILLPATFRFWSWYGDSADIAVTASSLAAVLDTTLSAQSQFTGTNPAHTTDDCPQCHPPHIQEYLYKDSLPTIPDPSLAGPQMWGWGSPVGQVSFNEAAPGGMTGTCIAAQLASQGFLHFILKGNGYFPKSQTSSIELYCKAQSAYTQFQLFFDWSQRLAAVQCGTDWTYNTWEITGNAQVPDPIQQLIFLNNGGSQSPPFQLDNIRFVPSGSFDSCTTRYLDVDPVVTTSPSTSSPSTSTGTPTASSTASSSLTPTASDVPTPDPTSPSPSADGSTAPSSPSPSTDGSTAPPSATGSTTQPSSSSSATTTGGSTMPQTSSIRPSTTSSSASSSSTSSTSASPRSSSSSSPIQIWQIVLIVIFCLIVLGLLAAVFVIWVLPLIRGQGASAQARSQFEYSMQDLYTPPSQPPQ